jgi:hypothetical protein
MPARYKINVSLTLSPDVVDMIGELANVTGWTRTRCVEECVRYAYPEIKRRFMAIKDRREEGEKGGNEEERLREEYWRRVYLGQIKAGEWEPEWWPV